MLQKQNRYVKFHDAATSTTFFDAQTGIPMKEFKKKKIILANRAFFKYIKFF